MHYETHYDRLMERAKDRILEGYTEKHHVNPRCLGGSNDSDNIVVLTAEEHYVAHLLLIKMYPGDLSLLWASIYMAGGNSKMSRKNKLYGWQRRQFAEALSIRMTGSKVSEETRQKMSEAQHRRKAEGRQTIHSEETKAKMSIASKGIPKSDAHREAMSEARSGKKLGRRTSTRVDSLSGYAGIRHRRNEWTVTVSRKWVGAYRSLDEAIKARDRAITRIGG